MGQIMVDLGGAEQRLGRDAAPVEADAAKLLALHDRDLEPELRGADRGNIAAGARTEDDEIVAVRHGGSSCCRRERRRAHLEPWRIARWSGEAKSQGHRRLFKDALQGKGLRREV